MILHGQLGQIDETSGRCDNMAEVLRASRLVLLYKGTAGSEFWSPGKIRDACGVANIKSHLVQFTIAILHLSVSTVIYKDSLAVLFNIY